jgi:hypothetical protein
LSDRTNNVATVNLRWARAATKHRISRDRSSYVIEHCGLRFEQGPPDDAQAGTSMRIVFLGEDAKGAALEVMAVELDDGSLLVIHAMPLRNRYRKQYEEAKKWRR